MNNHLPCEIKTKGIAGWTYHAVIKCEHSNISAVVNVVSSNDRVSVVFHPNSC